MQNQQNHSTVMEKLKIAFNDSELSLLLISTVHSETFRQFMNTHENSRISIVDTKLDTQIFDFRNRGHLDRHDGSPLEIAYRYKYQKLPSDTKETFEMQFSGAETVGETVRIDRPENTRRADLIGSIQIELKDSFTNIDNIRTQIGSRLNTISNEANAVESYKLVLTKNCPEDEHQLK